MFYDNLRVYCILAQFPFHTVDFFVNCKERQLHLKCIWRTNNIIKRLQRLISILFFASNLTNVYDHWSSIVLKVFKYTMNTRKLYPCVIWLIREWNINFNHCCLLYKFQFISNQLLTTRRVHYLSKST